MKHVSLYNVQEPHITLLFFYEANMKCKICKKEIVNNGFKWIHGCPLSGSIEIGANQPKHKAIPALKPKNNKRLQRVRCARR